MAGPNSDFTELVATTIRKRNKKFADNVTNNNAILYKLEKNNHVKPAGGGTSIAEELEYAENGTAGFFSGYETLPTTAAEVLSAASFDWKQASCQIVANGLEIRTVNKNKEQMIPLLEARIQNGMNSMKNIINTSIFSDGTGTSGKEIGGLQLLVADDPTTSTSVGGINQSTYSFWRNKIDNTTMTSANVLSRMNLMWLNLTRGADHPDLIVADNDSYVLYEGELQQLQRFQSSDMAEAGFTTLRYKGADFVYDDGANAGGANRMYFLNSQYLYMRYDPDTHFTPLERRASFSQDAFMIPVLWTGNLTTCNRSLQGVIFA